MINERTRTQFIILIILVIFLGAITLNLVFVIQKMYLAIHELKLEISFNNSCEKYSHELQNKNTKGRR